MFLKGDTFNAPGFSGTATAVKAASIAVLILLASITFSYAH